MNLKNGKATLYLMGFFVIICVISLIPFLIYHSNVNGFEVSMQTGVWGSYGDYISGTVGVMLTFFALTLSLISIYITSITSKQIKDKEFQIIQIQNKPMPYLDFLKYDNETKIELQNLGNGTMIITKIEIFKSDIIGNLSRENTYNNFRHLLTGNGITIVYLQDKDFPIDIFYYTAPSFILQSGKSKELFRILFNDSNLIENNKESNINSFNSIQNEIRDLIRKYTVKIYYNDIFDKKFNLQFDLSYFRQE